MLQNLISQGSADGKYASHQIHVTPLSPSNRGRSLLLRRLRPLCLVLLLCLSLFSCAIHTCRVQSILDAEDYARQGYDTRIAVYRLGFEGKVWGLGIWQYHAQGQVYMDGKWHWLDNAGPSDSPTYSMADDEIYYWTVNEYKRLLDENGRYY